MAKEYIEREAFINWVKEFYPNDKHFLSGVINAPTADVVEVVRCKDCGNYNKRYGECNLNGSHFGENGFCSCGAKMDKQ